MLINLMTSLSLLICCAVAVAGAYAMYAMWREDRHPMPAAVGLLFVAILPLLATGLLTVWGLA